MISETAHSSQTKLIWQSLPNRGHRIGYSNLAFSISKGQKRPIFGFKPLKCLDGLEIQSLIINIKEFITKNPLKIGNTRKYLLCGYILGVLTHTTAWDRHWGGDIPLDYI